MAWQQAIADGDYNVECRLRGADGGYLSKPIDPNALFDVVDRQLLVSAAGGELRPTIPRDAAALPSATRD